MGFVTSKSASEGGNWPLCLWKVPTRMSLSASARFVIISNATIVVPGLEIELVEGGCARLVVLRRGHKFIAVRLSLITLRSSKYWVKND